MINKIKKTLSNFPDEVIEIWLLPFANSEGWPLKIGPDGLPLERWRYLLMKKPLEYFRKMKWTKEEKHISIHEIEAKSQSSLVQIFEAAILNRNNMMSASIFDLKTRFDGVVDYIRHYGRMPKEPILYRHENGKYKILDGNHRLAAYYYSYGYFKVDNNSDLILKTQENQTYWIASH